MLNPLKKNKPVPHTDEIDWYKGILMKEFKKINDEIFTDPIKAEKAYGQFCTAWNCN